jgi:hypothetical protein
MHTPKSTLQATAGQQHILKPCAARTMHLIVLELTAQGEMGMQVVKQCGGNTLGAYEMQNKDVQLCMLMRARE